MEGENFRHTGDGRACIESPPLAILIPLLVDLLGLSDAGVAQLVEHLICNQRVGGSIPSASSTTSLVGERGGAIPDVKIERAGVFRHESVLCFCRLAAEVPKQSDFGTRVCVPMSWDGWVSG